MDRNRNKSKKKILNINRLEKISSELEEPIEEPIEEENNQIEKTPFQKMILYVYIIIVIGLLLIGGYIIYKYIKKKKTINIIGGSVKSIEKISTIDRRSINELLDKFID